MNSKIAIIGAGGHARVIAATLRASNKAVFGIFDDSYRGHEIIQGIPILGNFNSILNYKETVSEVYLAIGDNALRKKMFNFLQLNDFAIPHLIHPSAILESDSTVGSGTIVCIGAILATEATIGKGVIINTGCSVDHESKIGDYSHLAPKVSVAGRTTIGDCTFVGMNTCIADKIKVGSNVIIGAGSVILRNVPDGESVVGVYH